MLSPQETLSGKSMEKKKQKSNDDNSKQTQFFLYLKELRKCYDNLKQNNPQLDVQKVETQLRKLGVIY